ncbi:MAG: cell division protein FtsL [Elusimicrobia bacterium]|nr:cell division protein FtsL [Elusimicrobiota bacterium]
MERRFPIYGLLMLGLLASVMVFERVYATHMGKAVADAREDLKFRQARNEHMQMELEQLKSPSSVEQMAHDRLGMVYPDPDRVLALGDSASARPDTSGWLARMFEKKESGN